MGYLRRPGPGNIYLNPQSFKPCLYPSHRKIRLCNSSIRSRRNQRPVLGETTTGIVRSRLRPIRQASSDFSVCKLHVETARLNIDHDAVPLLQSTDRPSICPFVIDMTNHQTSRCTAEPAIGE